MLGQPPAREALSEWLSKRRRVIRGLASP